MRRQSLFDRYTLRDAAIKVVGVGSVGTLCWVLLLTAGEDALSSSFSMAYADQNEEDHDALERAVHSGKVKATFEEEK